MKALIVLAHPEPSSFNAELARIAADELTALGYEPHVSDLYAKHFDPREGPNHYVQRERTDFFDVQSEQRHASMQGTLPADVAADLEDLRTANLLILQFPMWWFSVPAILKGWIDRILAYGATYTSKMRYGRGHLRGRRAMLSVTLGGPQSTFAHNGRNGDIQLLLWPIQMSLHYVGYSVLPPFTAFGVGSGEPALVAADRAAHKQAYRQHLRNIAGATPLKFNDWGDWDDSGRLKRGVSSHSYFIRTTK